MGRLGIALIFLLPVQDVEETVRGGFQMLEKGEAEAAIAAFESALAKNPKHAAARVGRARVWMKLKREPEEILQEFERALRDDPRQADAYLNRGLLLDSLNRSEEALKEFDRAIELVPQGAGIAWSLRGSCLYKLKRYAEAVQDLDRAIASDYRTPQTYYTRAWTHCMLLNPIGVIGDTSRVLALDPEQLACLGLRWVAYYQIEAWDNALRDIRAYAKASKMVSERVAVWMYLASCQAGKAREDAREMLHAWYTSGGQANPDWPIAALLLGLQSEADFLAAAKGDGLREVFAAHARSMSGDEDGALKLFERAVKLLDSTRTESADARAAIRKIKRGKHRARLEELENKLRALKPFEARFEGEEVVFTGGRKIEAIQVRTDYAGRRSYFDVTSLMDGEEARAFIYGDGMRIALWGDTEYKGTIDTAPFLAGFEDIAEGMTRSLDKIAPPRELADKREDRPLGHSLNLTLMGADKPGEGATVKFAAGFGTRPASWLSEAMEHDDLSVREDGGEVVLHMPATRKSIRVDRDTGFPSLIEARDKEGDIVRRLRRTSFKFIDTWPDPGLPADLKPMPMDPGEIGRQLETQDFPLVLYLREAMDRWDAIPEEDQPQVEVAVVRWVARYADSVYAQGVRRAARTLIQEALDNGADVAALLKDVDGNAQRFAARIQSNAGALDAHLQQALSILSYRVESGVIASWVSSETHPTLRKLLRSALSLDRVGAARKAAYGDRLEKLYQEELATFRKL